MTRKVVTRSPHREVGIVNASWLLDHGVEHESHLERRFIIVALACPVVTDITHQPFEIFLGPDKTHRYTPDFLVTFANGDKVVIEVKPRVFVKDHKARLEAAKGALAAMGFRFLVVTDKEIDAHGLSSRALLLMRYGRLFIGEMEALTCRKILEKTFKGNASVKQLVDQGVSEETLWNLVARHQFRTPSPINLSPNQTVSINQPEENCNDFFCTWLGVA